MKTHRTRKVDEKTHYGNTSGKSDMKKMSVEVYESGIKMKRTKENRIQLLRIMTYSETVAIVW